MLVFCTPVYEYMVAYECALLRWAEEEIPTSGQTVSSDIGLTVGSWRTVSGDTLWIHTINIRTKENKQEKNK